MGPRHLSCLVFVMCLWTRRLLLVSPNHLPLKDLWVLFFVHDHKGEQHFLLLAITLNYAWSLISFLKASIHSTTAWQRQQQRWCSYCGEGGSKGEGGVERVCGMSSQIVFTFHHVGSLSIQLFICISAGVYASSWHVSVYVYVEQLPK